MPAIVRTVPPEYEGRMIKYFVRGQMGVSHHQFTSLKTRDGMKVNGTAVHANYLLRQGDSVEILLEDECAIAVIPDPTPVNVVYEDEDVFIIDKPAPLACQCSVRQTGMTLENRLASRYPGMTFRPLNRLDKGTSGLMAAAKHAYAAQRLQRQLHTDDFIREYIAIVEGSMTGEGIIEAPIIKAEGATIRRAVDITNGKPAVTHYRAERVGEGCSSVRLRLQTGRTHQIRVHMAHIGHPVVGDFLYGREDSRLPGRFALHSTYIRFSHPITGKAIEAVSPLPEELGRLMDDEYHLQMCNA